WMTFGRPNNWISRGSRPEPMRFPRRLDLVLLAACAPLTFAAAAPQTASPATATQRPPPPATTPPVQPRPANGMREVPPRVPLPGETPQAAHLARQAAAVEANPTWAATVERIASSVVSINVDEVRAFDTEWYE